MVKQVGIYILLLTSFSVFSQTLDHRLGEIIVQLEDHIHPRNLVKTRSFSGNIPRTYHALIPEMNIWTLRFNQNSTNEIDYLTELRSLDDILNAQFNYFIQFRKTPNDPLFDEQWQYLNVGQLGAPVGIDFQMEQVWDITTGGVTSEGDTIVICVIDDGLDPSHLDILPNLWHNIDEIPNNDIDDDNNGYVDDYNGWNVQSEDDNIFKGGRHGTAVTGIVGAKGNNNIGVTGMNWDVKLMIISGISDIASVLAAYSYPLKMRKIYNQSEGKKGAFVVSTNASWGISDLFPSDAPIWCAFYDSLGNAGILNCGAAPNNDVDVDVVGDLPSTCTSDFFIGVTNINHFDQLQSGSGFGAKSIDLGAFGEDAYTTAKNNTYRSFGGTSGATPHVTGAIGLLYASMDCNNLAQLSRDKPSMAALTAKAYLLNNTKLLGDLANNTTTGGRMNILDAMTSISPLVLQLVEDKKALISWTTHIGNPFDTIRWRISGSTTWTEHPYSAMDHLLTELNPCSKYEVQIKGICSNNLKAYSNSFIFKTLGCCKLPDEIKIHTVIDNSISWSFSDVFAADAYLFEYKDIRKDEWISKTLQKVDSSIYWLNLLEPCTEYLIRFRTICSDSSSIYSDTLQVRTTGCGACMDLDYCLADIKPISSSDWIQQIIINEEEYESGNNDGYGDFTSIGPDLLFIKDSMNEIKVDIGNTSSASNEILRAWIDYNHDGKLTDAELIISPSTFVTDKYEGNFTVPTNALTGNTRMRIAIKWPGFDGTTPRACDEIEFGEIEDYCVQIDAVVSCKVPDNIDTSWTSLNAISLNWSNIAGASSYLVNYRPVGQNNWIDTSINHNQINISGLEKCNKYEFRIRTICASSIGMSNWSNIREFSTRCTSNIGDSYDYDIILSPNPFTNYIQITSLEHFDHVIIYQNGKIIYEGNDQIVDTQNWNSGMYLVVVKTKNGNKLHKMVKI